MFPTEASSPPGAALPPFVVLYDGACGLCHRTVAWLAARDRERHLAFTPLQGRTAARLRALHPEIPANLDSVVYLEPGGVFLRSRALLRLSRHLAAPWRWGFRLRWLPSAPLDLAYRLVARARHRLRIRPGACAVPAGADGARFLP